jgi:hypothetical protein
VGLVVTGRTLSHIARHLITRRLLAINPEDEVLKQIHIEGSRNQISQTFYGPGATPFLPISVNHTGNLLHFYLWQ